MNQCLVGRFLDWLDGGPQMTTNVRDNLQSMALVTAAIESSHTGASVDVQQRLARTSTAQDE